ncbi:hypothetical protein RP300_02357 [Oligella urethralis]|nr:hypothetical protein RP300_02357 [Oligella urethralis]
MGYYIYRKRKPSATMLRHEWLTTQIKRVFEQHKGRYGSPRIALQLYAEGIETNKRVVAMLMQRAGLVSVYSRRRLKNRQQRLKSSASLYQNLLNRDLCNNPSNFLKYGLFPCFLTSVP